MANLQVDDPHTRAFLRKFLGSDDHALSIDEARSSLVVGSRYGNASNKHIVLAAHIIFRYRLLDVVAEVLGVPCSQDLPYISRIPSPQPVVGRLDKVCVIHSRD